MISIAVSEIGVRSGDREAGLRLGFRRVWDGQGSRRRWAASTVSESNAGTAAAGEEEEEVVVQDVGTVARSFEEGID